jgi:hypothetical protein
MLNPLRSEAEAFRLVLLLLAYLAAIVAADRLGGRWAALAVFAGLTVAAGVWLVRAKRREPVRRARVVRHDGGGGRILVVANETVEGEPLRDLIAERAREGGAEVFVVAPALNTPLRHWASDEDGARAEAQARLDRSLAQLAAAGVRARGEVGADDPLQAIEDALRTFGADEIVVSTHPEGRSNWLERGVVEGARARFDVPLTHVVVDVGGDRPAGKG